MKYITLIFIIVSLINVTKAKDKAIIRYSNGIIKVTEDNGESWKVNYPNPNASFYRNGILKTTKDIGNTWTVEYYSKNAKISYLNGIEKITSNGGKTWHLMSNLNASIQSDYKFEFNSDFIKITKLQNIKLSKSNRMLICDIKGNILKQLDLNPLLSNGEFTYDLSGFASGIYILSIIYENNKTTKLFSVIK